MDSLITDVGRVNVIGEEPSRIASGIEGDRDIWAGTGVSWMRLSSGFSKASDTEDAMSAFDFLVTEETLLKY